jgi:hypothetical protein
VGNLGDANLRGAWPTRANLNQGLTFVRLTSAARTSSGRRLAAPSLPDVLFFGLLGWSTRRINDEVRRGSQLQFGKAELQLDNFNPCWSSLGYSRPCLKLLAMRALSAK